jgi:hypothetical protein
MGKALTTSPPSGANSAQEKSSRSLMFVLTAVRCNVRPICSAMPMNRLLKIERFTGSTGVGCEVSLVSFLFSKPATSTAIFKSPNRVKVASHPGSMTHVAVPFIMTAGPLITTPDGRVSMRKIGVSHHPLSKNTCFVVSGVGAILFFFLF